VEDRSARDSEHGSQHGRSNVGLSLPTPKEQRARCVPGVPFACQNRAELSHIERHRGDEEARRDHADSGRMRRPDQPCKRMVSGSSPLTGSIVNSQNAPADSSRGGDSNVLSRGLPPGSAGHCFYSNAVFGGMCIIQAKRYRGAVGVEAIRALAGVMEDKHATKGILITTSWVTKDGHAFAARHGRIEIMECEQVKYLCKEHLGLDVLISLPKPPPR
jgi:hypothetical protein